MSWATKKTLLFTSTTLAASVVATSVFAGGFALREQSAYYQGMSFAGYGTTGDSISSMFWNPATITGAGHGITHEQHGTLVMPYGELEGTNSFPAFGLEESFRTNDFASDAFLPAGYTTYKASDSVYFGLAVTAPYGLSTKIDDDDWTGAGYNQSSKIFSININPLVGFKVNEKFSFAFGPQVQYADIRLRNATASPSIAPSAPDAALVGNGWGVGVTAGLTFKPIDAAEIGIGYRSAIFTNIGGNVKIGDFSDTKVNTIMPTPDMITVSGKYSFTENIRVLGSFEWTNWSRLQTPKVIIDGTDAQLTTLPFNYNDGYFVALGGEYDFNEKLTLRAGLAYEWSPIDEEIRSVRLPDSDRLWVSGGASYTFNEHVAFDIGYTHIFPSSADINIGPGHQDYDPVKGDFVGSVEDGNVNIVSASVKLRF
ncbi:OmpP1/FadL family transporter [Roseibium sp. RKSG952]|uniref:OmpP1/FadL family transporter n=1 Tax=Roseibium sp. RKSG952 TaxID=2529384 RepID=UPI0012BBE95C|nr:OmpP1/FadL family transporter [Roseibium sp. RKSG952]MTH97789.1 transporter [Roseibium sp. RKSG952]